MEYDRLLENRKAVITGGSAGIGLETAKLFARHGALVAVLDCDNDAVIRAVDELREASPNCVGFSGNLSDAAEVGRLCKLSAEALKGVDILVNAAGVYNLGAAHELAEEDFLSMLSLNVKCAIRCAKNLVPLMCDNRRGDIINITSDLATSSLPHTAGIAAAAGAIFAFSRSLTMDYIRYHVRSNCIMVPADGLPGRMPLLDGSCAGSSHAANAALWFACDFSRFIIGEALPVNGGMSYFVS